MNGRFSHFEKNIPWDLLHLSENQNVLSVEYVQGVSEVKLKEIEIVLDTHSIHLNTNSNRPESSQNLRIEHSESV